MEIGFDNNLYVQKQTEKIQERIAQFSGKLDLLRGWHTVCWYIARGEEGENLMFLDGRQIFTGKGLFPAGVCGLRIGSRWNTRKTPAENGFAVAFFAHSELPFPQ